MLEYEGAISLGGECTGQLSFSEEFDALYKIKEPLGMPEELVIL